MSSLIDYCAELEEERREAARSKTENPKVKEKSIMPTIKFSSNYPKLHNQTSARLLYVERIRIDQNTPPELLEYDTTKADGSRFPLKPGNYIQLVFLGNFGIPFCTIRPAWPSGKETFYKCQTYNVFKIEVKND